MAEAIGVASGLVALATFAFTASAELHNAIQSFKSHQQRVRDLAEETGALSGVLASLADTVNAANCPNLSALEIPLQRCGKACQEFEQEIRKVSSRSTDKKTSFRDWARLRYMGEDVDGFRRLLSGYRMTITIALTDANLRQSTATAESLESYNELLSTARADLEDRLESIDEKLELILARGKTGSDIEASEAQQIEEERLSTEKCLQICAQLSEHISQIQRSNMSSDASDSNSVPKRITNEGLQECKESLTRMAAKLASHEKELFNRLVEQMKSNNASPGETADIARLRDEWESAHQSMEILSLAGRHLEESASVIENHATGDAVQVMVSANGKALNGTNRGLGWRSRQIGGYLSDETVRQISRDMVSISAQGTSIRQPPLQEKATSSSDGALETGRDAKFREQYGNGFSLTSKPSF